MYENLFRPQDKPAGPHARQIPSEYHIGTYEDFLRRHEVEARQAALKNKAERKDFASLLLERSADTRNLRIAIEHCERSSDASGPDRFQPSMLDDQARWELARQLGLLIKNLEYRNGNVRPLQIAKGLNRGMRTIVIQDFFDRVVERAILQVIGPWLEPAFLNCSMGFRRPATQRSRALAIAERIARKGEFWTWITADIENAFDKVPVRRLDQVLRKQLLSDDICDFIKNVTNHDSRFGILQRSLSPLLLNCYLHHFLDRWWYKRFPDWPLIRFADDLLILATPEKATELWKCLAERLVIIGMPLKGDANEAIHNLLMGETVSWLGFKVSWTGDELIPQISDKSWWKLEEAFLLTWNKPNPCKYCDECIEGWIYQNGACFKEHLVETTYQQVTKLAGKYGLTEIPDIQNFKRMWSKGQQKMWTNERRQVIRDINNGWTLLTSVFACSSALQYETAIDCRSENYSQTTPIRRELQLYTDGSCLKSNSGGWAYVINDMNGVRLRQDSGHHPRTTNNRMEMCAAIQGLESIEEPSKIHLFTDSRYLCDGIKRLEEWYFNGFRKKRGGRVANQKKWMKLNKLMKFHEVSWNWVKAHSGYPENEYVDMQCRKEAMENQQSKGL